LADFPSFMKNPANRIAASSQHTPGVEGYVFDGADGGQMAFWTCREAAVSAEHVHDYDEYMVVIEGRYILLMEGRRLSLGPGQECVLPRGVPHSGLAEAGTRTIHAFGGHRADRQNGRHAG
jgi:mannose-6-phosphate isomerase-like protein (cupin superfamily)